MLQVIHGKRIRSTLEDLMLLEDARDESFWVNLLYKVLDGPRAVVFTNRFIWNIWVPSKVGFFARPLRLEF